LTMHPIHTDTGTHRQTDSQTHTDTHTRGAYRSAKRCRRLGWLTRQSLCSLCAWAATPTPYAQTPLRHIHTHTHLHTHTHAHVHAHVHAHTHTRPLNAADGRTRLVHVRCRGVRGLGIGYGRHPCEGAVPWASLSISHTLSHTHIYTHTHTSSLSVFVRLLRRRRCCEAWWGTLPKATWTSCPHWPTGTPFARYTHTHTYTHIHTYTHTYIDTCTHAQMQTCTPSLRVCACVDECVGLRCIACPTPCRRRRWWPWPPVPLP
jgi:hypothetical protein